MEMGIVADGSWAGSLFLGVTKKNMQGGSLTLGLRAGRKKPAWLLLIVKKHAWLFG